MVLNEYLVRIFALVDASRRLEAQQKLELINIVSVPHLKKADSRRIIDSYFKILSPEGKPDQETIKKERAALLKKLRGQGF